MLTFDVRWASQHDQPLGFFFVVDCEHWQTTSGPGPFRTVTYNHCSPDFVVSTELAFHSSLLIGYPYPIVIEQVRQGHIVDYFYSSTITHTYKVSFINRTGGY